MKRVYSNRNGTKVTAVGSEFTQDWCPFEAPPCAAAPN